jgi:hypothetical protein
MLLEVKNAILTQNSGNIYVTLAKRPSRTEVVVILVGENLGI